MSRHRMRPVSVPLVRNTQRNFVLGLMAPVVLGALAACGGGRDSGFDQQLRADLLAAAQAPTSRQMYASPAELGYPQGYAPYPGQYPVAYGAPGGYPMPVYPQPVYQRPQTRVVYAPAPASTSGAARHSSGDGAGSARPGNGNGSSGDVGDAGGQAGRRQTEKGAIYGAAAGAAIGVLSSRDRAQGAAVGALGGAVLGGIIGHEVRRPE